MLEISIILKTSDFRGDHATDVSVAHRYKPGETIEELVDRTLRDPHDHIEIRIVKELK